MKVNQYQKIFVEEERKVSVYNELKNNIVLAGNIFILSENFVEYQKDLFNEFYSNLLDKLSEEDIDLKTFQRYFENSLQDLNSKLNVFSEKIKEKEDYLPIKGVVSIFFGETYIASMIGDVSISIFRDNKLNYTINNDLIDGQGIDTFSEFIEGEVEDGDSIVIAGTQLKSFVDDKEIQESIETSVNEEKGLIDILGDIGTSRMENKDLVFLDGFEVESNYVFNKDKVSNIKENIKFLQDIKNVLLRFRYPIVISLIVFVVLFLFYFVISSFISNSGDKVEVVENGEVVVGFTKEDLKKEISMFQKMDPSSESKVKKYQDIMEKIKVLEEKDKWVHDVKELKEILNKEYYKGFNIALVSSLDESQRMVKYSSSQKENMGDINNISYYNNKFLVGGNKGAIVGAANENVKGKTVEYNLSKDIYGCTTNLLKNGAYCYSTGTDIFNITREGLQQITTRSGGFPENIKDIGTYGASNFYVLTNQEDLNQEGTYIKRYTNLPGSQNDFGEGINYKLSDSSNQENQNSFKSGFNNFSIDGTFLMWNGKEKALNQFWRDPDSGMMNSREINLQGGVDAFSGYSSNVKVMSFQSSRYVYLFDKENQTFTVYRSTPYKTNTSYTTSYELRYFFRLDFDISGQEIVDTYVDIGTKPLLYLTTDKGLYKVDLYEFFESFTEEE